MPEKKQGIIHINGDAGAGAGLAKEIGTPEGEYQKALEKGYTYPAAGVPDCEAIFETFGLMPELLSETDFTRLPGGTQKPRP